MADNPGVYPLDPTTEVGKFRLEYGDTQSVPYNPVVPGIQNYTELSDAEIEQLLAKSDGNITRAIGYYFLRLSGEAAKQSKSVKDYDLSVDLSKRSSDLARTAQEFFNRADDEDAGAEDAFLIVPTGHRDWIRRPEASPWWC